MESAQFEVFRDSEIEGPQHADDQYYWHLKSPNGQIIAIGGEGYATKAGAYRAIGTVQGAVMTIVAGNSLAKCEADALAAEPEARTAGL